MAKKQFKAESKKLLDLMINSIYTNKEIFLRELISNASDALDKRHFLSLTDKDNAGAVLEIDIKADKENRTLTISDTGIGMNKEDLENNLGTIAHSGSAAFREENPDESVKDIIGQFGVGFYSAFMVAKSIQVDTLKMGETQGYRWTSEGVDGYTITPIDRETIGTTITISLRDDTDDFKYSDFLETYKIRSLVRKYSDYVRYPIHMDVETSRLKAGSENEYETVTENQTLNTMVPLWKRNKKDITKEEYDSFYTSKFQDYSAPQKVIHYTVEGNLTYTAMLFIPSETPFNYFAPDYKDGVQLYSKGVFIVENAKNLIPDYFKFVKGVIDSDDISLNISRELLQEDAQLKAISKNVTNKIKSTLVDMLMKDREEYEKFFEHFGLSLKYGIYNDYGIHKEELQDLLLFKSSKEDKYVTLKEYVDRMPEDQKFIYYATGETLDQAKSLPQLEKVQAKGYEVLYFTDRVDEFMIRMMYQYMDKDFKSLTQGDLGLDSEEEKAAKEELEKNNSGLLESLKKALEGKVADVKLSSHLTSYPVCLSAGEGLSLDMEKTLNQVPEAAGGRMKADRILEINPDNPLFEALQKVNETDPEKLDQYAKLMYNQALLVAGFDIEDPVEYSKAVCDLIVGASK